MTDQEVAERIVDIQEQMYGFYGIHSLPAANHESLLKEMDEWMADQLRKTSFFDMINNDIIDMVDELYNAHEIAYVCSQLKGR